MERKYPNLSKPITLGRTTFRNRMFSAPMGGTDIANDGCIGPKSTAFYELRGKGGAAAVTVSECMVHPATDGSHAYHLDESILNSLACATYTADAIRRHGAIPSLELSHSGMFAGTYMTDKSKQKSLNQWGPCDTVRADGVEVKALTVDMIHEITAAYAHVAGLAKRAGFELLMIHGGHGWLINQFLSPLFNHREDEYGGSLENRCRFAVEVLKAVREAVGPFFPIEFRMSGAEFVEDGYDLDEGVRIAQMVEPYVDLIHVSAGTYQKTFGITHPSMFTDHGRNVFLAAEIKKHVSKPVATIGGLAGCECAIHLGQEGKKVHLVEMRDELAPDANVRHRPLLLAEIEKYATVHTGYRGLEVMKEGILCEDKNGEKQLVPGTSVICALGQRSRTDVVEALMDTAPYVRVIGDAARVSTITNAVYWGYHAALDI